MATKREINKWLKENGYTWEMMQAFWDECIPTNPIIANASKNGINWDRMNMSVISELPTQKQRDLDYIREKKEKEKAEAEEKRRKEEEAKYYAEHFEEIIVNKIDNGEKLTEEELKEIVWDYDVESSYGDNRRWTRSVSTVVSMCGRYFMVDWKEGLTEYQENEFWEQPYEVERKEYEKTIKVVEWVKK